MVIGAQDGNGSRFVIRKFNLHETWGIYKDYEAEMLILPIFKIHDDCQGAKLPF